MWTAVLVATRNAMRLLSLAAFLTLSAVAFAAVAFAAVAAPLPSPHQVEIPFSGGTLHAQLYKPDGDGPFPKEPAPVPTLWVLTKPMTFRCPWGQRAFLRPPRV